MEKVRIISVYGPTAVGKSTISKALVDRFGQEKANRISLDRYLADRQEGIELLGYLQNPVDWDLLESHLRLPLGTVIKSPEFDFEKFKRVPGDTGKETILTPIIIIDGAWPYVKADVLIKLTSSSDTRKGRLIDRHLNERGGVDKQWVQFAQENWDALPGEYPNFQPTVTISTEKSLDEILNEIEKYLF